MKDDSRTEQQAPVSRQDLYEDYVKCYRELCPEVRPCRDDCLLRKAAQYLLREPEPAGTFTVFPFYQAVTHLCEAPSSDCRKRLTALIKATELLETVCLNLFIQPWRKEIKTLKAFTGPFVYCLLPVLSSSTIQSVLASIGYLPHTDTPHSCPLNRLMCVSEYRLSKEADPHRAMLLGFELLLARVECYHLLELLEKEQLGAQEWLKVLQRRAGPAKLDETTEKKTTVEPKEEEEEEEEEEEKKEEADRKEVPQCLDSRCESAVKPQPKPRRRHVLSVDPSIMEMQMTYPDLAFRGRPLLPDKPQRASSSRSRGSTDVQTTSDNNYSEDSKAAELPKRHSVKGARAAATAARCKYDGGKADEVFGDDSRDSGCHGRDSGCHDRTSGETSTPGDTSISTTDGGRGDDELSGPQAISLHITLRAGSQGETSLKQAEPPVHTNHQAAEDLQNKRQVIPKLPSLSSMEEAQDLRELAERMGQLNVQDTREEAKRQEENKRGEESRERRKKGRKTSTEGEAEEQSLRRPLMEWAPAPSRAASRRSRPSHSDAGGMREQRQPSVCPHSALSVSAADCSSCEGGGSTQQQDGEDTVTAETGRGQEEQLANSFVIVEHHRK